MPLIEVTCRNNRLDRELTLPVYTIPKGVYSVCFSRGISCQQISSQETIGREIRMVPLTRKVLRNISVFNNQSQLVGKILNGAGNKNTPQKNMVVNLHVLIIPEQQLGLYSLLRSLWQK